MRPIRNISSTVLALALGLPCAGQASDLRMMAAHDQEKAGPLCTASADWFKPNAPEPSFELEDINCAFHKWAVQEFLYLVQKGPDELARFLSLASPHALFLYEGVKPKPYPGTMATQFKLGAGMARLRSGQGKSAAVHRVVFLPRTLKTENTTFNADTQAGSNAVLVDQKGQVVYYTAQINKVYYDFVVKEGYYTLKAFLNAPAATVFPVGTVETKSSWRIAVKDGTTYIPDAAKTYYTVEGEVCKDNGDCKPESMVPATMALVGLHVVGRVEHHPEMVWATFEQNANAPDCKDTPFPKGGYSFYSGGKNCGKAPFWETCNQIRKDDWKTPSEICRAHPYGEPGDKPENTLNIKSMNDSFYALLPAGSVWKNYFYAGSVWTTGKTDGPGLIKLDDASIRGSKKAANTSLESFTQEKNCLHCHTYQPQQLGNECFPPITTSSGWKNLYVSHLFGLLCQPKS
jgi:hypothetical protein